MVKKILMIILLSIILLTGCELKSANQNNFVNGYTNVSYVESKKENDVTTTTTTTTNSIINTTTSTTTTSTTKKNTAKQNQNNK